MQLKTASKDIGQIHAGERYIQFTGAVADALAEAGRKMGIFTNRRAADNGLLVFFSANGVRAVTGHDD